MKIFSYLLSVGLSGLLFSCGSPESGPGVDTSFQTEMQKNDRQKLKLKGRVKEMTDGKDFVIFNENGYIVEKGIWTEKTPSKINDPLIKVTKETRTYGPDGKLAGRRVDGLTNHLSIWDDKDIRKNAVIEYKYNEFGNPVEEKIFKKERGQLVLKKTYTSEYAYNWDGTQKLTIMQDGSKRRVIEYDRHNNKKKETIYYSGEFTENTYNNQGLVSTSKEYEFYYGGGDGHPLKSVWEYTYDPYGNVSSEYREDYRYHSKRNGKAKREVGQTHSKSYYYEYDEAGNWVKRKDDVSSKARERNFTYYE